MFDEKTNGLIASAVGAELLNAKKIGLAYNTSHECYGVLLEEVEEAQENMIQIENHMKAFWQMVKANDYKGQKIELGLIATFAINLAKEACQVAAVAYKSKGFDDE